MGTRYKLVKVKQLRQKTNSENSVECPNDPKEKSQGKSVAMTRTRGQEGGQI